MNPLLESKWTALQEVIKRMLEETYAERPTCAELLSQFNSFDITYSEVKKDNNYNKNMNQMNEYSNKFFNNYFEEKTK